MSDSNAPIALEAYEKLAHGYAAIAETKAENGYTEHPAMRARMGDVSGLVVLDAGCGPGFLLRDLLHGGAAGVVGIDISPTMLEISRERLGSEVELIETNLGAPLPLDDDSFDLVVSSLALDYVRDWSVPLSEFRRVLKPKGRLVFSVLHPLASYKWFKPPSAFGVHYCESQWKTFTEDPVTVPDHYRSFEEIINPILAAGFQLQNVHETRPIEALRDVDPKHFEEYSIMASFMVLEAISA